MADVIPTGNEDSPDKVNFSRESKEPVNVIQAKISAGEGIEGATKKKNIRNWFRIFSNIFLFFTLVTLAICIYTSVVLNRVDSDIRKAVTICPSDMASGNDSWKQFLNNKKELDKKRNQFDYFYMYDMQNANAWQSGKETLKVQMYGPYAFKKYKRAQNVEWGTADDGLSTIKAEFTSTALYDGLETWNQNCQGPRGRCLIDDKVTNLNPTLLGAIGTAGSDENVSLSLISGFMAQFDVNPKSDICNTIRKMTIADTLAGGKDPSSGLHALSTALGDLWTAFGWSEEEKQLGQNYLANEMKKVIVPGGYGANSDGQGWVFNLKADTRTVADNLDPLADKSFLTNINNSDLLRAEQSYCACKSIVNDGTEGKRKFVTYLSVAIAYQKAFQKHAAASGDAKAAAKVEMDQTKALLDQSKNAAKSMLLMMNLEDIQENTDGSKAASKCSGGADFAGIFGNALQAQSTETHAKEGGVCFPTSDVSKTGSQDCRDAVAKTIYTKIFDSSTASHRAENGSNKAGNGNLALTCTKTNPNPLADASKIDNIKCYLRIGKSALERTDATDDVKADARVLIQIALAMQTNSDIFFNSFTQVYFTNLKAFTTALTFIPANRYEGNGATKDGLIITKTVGEWFYGFQSPLAKGLGLGNTGGYGSPEEGDDTLKNTPYKEERYSGCDKLKKVKAFYKTEDDGSLVKSIQRSTSTREVGAPAEGIPVKGFDATMSPSMGKKKFIAGEKTQMKSYNTWVDQAYQSVDLLPAGEENVSGIVGDKFHLDFNVLNYSDENKKLYRGVKMSYCDSGTSISSGTCGPSQVNQVNGVLDLKTLSNKAHSVLSFPMFLNAPASVRKAVEICDTSKYNQFNNCKPFPVIAEDDKEKYRTYTVFDRLTGATIKGHKRLQANISLDKNTLTVVCGGSNACKDTPTGTLIPIYWLDKTGFLTEKQSKDLLDLHERVKDMDGFDVIFWCFLFLPTILLFLLFTGLFYYYSDEKKKDDEIVDKVSSITKTTTTTTTMTV